ncbi:MAG: glycosyltransferase family 4 protein [Terrimonas sp.]|nr:glycosyltransferase family 4 protein [Terrimonas sp.]OJY87861.1 MAG: hypothetical protein BGP13_05410 [Sphingobacteriales bacterium 40-81]
MPEKKRLKFLFLYSRLPDYFYQCVKYLVEKAVPDSEAWVVCFKNDDNAPYELQNQHAKVRITGKKKLQELHQWNPDVLYVSGWIDKDYKKIARSWKQKVPVVIGVDNLWQNTWRQRLAAIVSGSYLRSMATHLWIPGYPQYEFVRRLGFPASHILFDMYCADTTKFYKQTDGFRKRIIFAGRMVEYKRPDLLLKTFVSLVSTDTGLQEWELLMVGNGPMQDKLKQQYAGERNIQFLPFVQPRDLVALYHDSCIFCMPSVHEHWGLVVQEAAAAGLALLLSDTCGAASAFLINGYNGAVFRSLDEAHFKKQLSRLMHSGDSALQDFGMRSRELSKKINHATWAANLMSVLHDS